MNKLYVGYLDGRNPSTFMAFTTIDKALENCIALIKFSYPYDAWVNPVETEKNPNADWRVVKSYSVTVIMNNDILAIHNVDIYVVNVQ